MENGKLNAKSFACASGIMWALAMLFVGLVNLIWPNYGVAFLELISSVYPGYDALPNLVSVLIGTAYALLDGIVCGYLFARIYNHCIGGLGK